MVDLITIVFW